MSRIRISCLLLGALGAAAVVSAQTAADSAALAQNAVQLQQSGRYAEAADAYRALLKLIPNDVATHVNLGVVLVNLGHYADAIAEYESAGKLLPGDPRIALNIALAYQKSGRLEEAQKRFENLHTAAPEDNRVTMLLADSLLGSGDNDRVIELLQPLRDSDDLGVAYMLGMALLRTQRLQEAQSFLDRILRNGDTAESRFLMGTRMFEAGDYAAAVKQLSGAIDLNPGLPRLQALYGEALLNTGDPDGAAAAFQKELTGNQNDYTANVSLGHIMTVRKRYADALPLIRRALDAQPGSSEAKLLMAQCLSGTHEYKEARVYGEAAVRELPRSAEAHKTMGGIDAGLQLASAAASERKLAAGLEREENGAGSGSGSGSGPQVDETSPDFALPEAGSRKIIRLADFRGKTPVVLVFGSYSCPNLRSSAEALKAMQRRYGAQVSFLLIYIREAHSVVDWQSTRNVREDVTLAPAVTMAEKKDHAATCSRRLHLPFPALVDKMDGAVETAYNAWPSRAFIIGRDGRVVYSTRLTELDFHAETMESVLREVSSGPAVSMK